MNRKLLDLDPQNPKRLQEPGCAYARVAGRPNTGTDSPDVQRRSEEGGPAQQFFG